MNLSRVLTRLGACVAGIVVFYIVLVINIIGTDIYIYYLSRAGSWTGSPVNWPLVVGWDEVGRVLLWGYPLSVGLTATCFFWNGWPQERARMILYFLVLVIVGQLALINYEYRDTWLNLWIQSIFNLFMAFCGYTVVLKIRALKGISADALAIKSLSILIITSILVAIPLFNTGIFLVYEFNMIDHHIIQSIPDKVPLVVAGSAGIIAAFLVSLDKLRAAKPDSQL